MKQRKDVNKVHLINVFKRKIKTKPKKVYNSLFETSFKNHTNLYLFDVTGMCVTESLKRTKTS